VTGDTAARRAAAEHQKLILQQQAEDDTRWLMADARGRRLVWQWLSDAGLFRSTYTGEALSAAFNEGQRNQGLKLHAQVMRHTPEQFIRMLAEAQAGGAHTAAGGQQSPDP